MKGFERRNPLFSLCGLNCLLCPMLSGGHCGGCGNGNQSCRIAQCSLEHGKIEYCYECGEYPCEKYQHIDDYDSFITHRRRREDLSRAQEMGADAYTRELQEKKKILDYLLENCNDGRRKGFFFLAANLLELPDLQGVVEEVQGRDELSSAPVKARGAYVAEAFQRIAERKNILLRLNKKKK